MRGTILAVFAAIVGVISVVYLFPKKDYSELRVYASVRAHAEMVVEIVGTDIEVGVLADKKGKQPSDTQKKALEVTQILITTGLPFEKGLIAQIRKTNPDIKVLNLLNEDDGNNPYIWLDPLKASIQAGKIRDILKQVDPGRSKTFDKNCDALMTRLNKIHLDIEKKTAPLKGRRVLTTGPEFHHFLSRYNLVDAEVQMKLTPASIRALTAQAQADDALAILITDGDTGDLVRQAGAGLSFPIISADAYTSKSIDQLQMIADIISTPAP